METRSNHVFVGGVVLALVALVLIGVIWMARISGATDKQYDIFFKQSVDGLTKGSAVTFSGVPAGQVKEIRLLPNQPEFVRVRVSVDQEIPVLQGTTATIAGVGFTGVSQINLNGAVRGARPIADLGPFGVPVIPTKPGTLGQLLNSAPELLDRLSTLTERVGELLSDDNQNSLKAILANVQRLSGALADQGPEIRTTLEQSRDAIRKAGDAAQEFGALARTANGSLQRDLQPTLANLNRTVATANHAMQNLDDAVGEARPGLRGLTTQTLPEAGQLVRDLSEMAEALTAVADRLNSGGASGLIRGRRLPDYKGK